MSFIKPDSKNEQFDDYKTLLCTVPGCGRKWTVKIESPQCSFHQWGVFDQTVNSAFTETHKDKGMKAWAYRLRDRHESGYKLNRNQIECYQSVLGTP
jgi:hypothetical protein